MGMNSLDPNKVDTIIIHITVSDYGDVATIDRWHKERGWSAIGYHFVITNCFPSRKRWEMKRPDPSSDGIVHEGRSTQFAGAHAKGHNWHTIGIALVGKKGAFTSRQIESAISKCEELKQQFPGINKIIGHFEVNEGKTCPDIDMDHFRELVTQGE